ncbi:MAG: glucose-6-phosphate isomerase family protein, partial [Patescibacteria group bacterium]
EGQAWYLIQRPQRASPRIIEEVYLIEAKENEKTIIPPGFGHVSINPENKKLILGNWVGTEFKYDYQTYENLRGACYYLLESRNGKTIDFEKNSYYEKMPELVKAHPREFPKELENLEFLIKPEKYLNLLTVENCFKKI